MFPHKAKTENRATASRGFNLAGVAITDADTDFVLSRQAMRATPSTLAFYGYTLGGFLSWLEGQGITTPADVEARQVRAFLVTIEGESASTVNAFARAIRTILRFWHPEGYIPAAVRFAMPKIEQKRLPSLTAEHWGIAARRAALRKSDTPARAAGDRDDISGHPTRTWPQHKRDRPGARGHSRGRAIGHAYCLSFPFPGTSNQVITGKEDEDGTCRIGGI